MARSRPVNDGEALGIVAFRRLAAYAVGDTEPGLTDAEFDRIERDFGFTFADDHRAFLTAGLPVNSGIPPPEPGVYYTHDRPWPDWRHDPAEVLLPFLTWPAAGVLTSVERGGWHPFWGSRPADHAIALEVAKARLAEVPVMVPLYGHRYLPAGRGSWGRAVLSMWGTDIIYYGNDLADYIAREFGPPRIDTIEPHPDATPAFWRYYL
jgi:hypothetical protein